MHDEPHVEGSDSTGLRVTDPERPVHFHLDEVLAFLIFWALAVIVFAQFFTRYVLNDSLAWTEEIARYLLMVLTFVGAAVVFRRRSHIAVEALALWLPMGAQRLLAAAVGVVTVAFVALLCWFSVGIIRRMGVQRMTVFDLPMSIVYGGVALGCVLMLWRAGQALLADARRGFRPPPNDLVKDDAKGEP